jgi:ribonuclease Z
VPLIEGIDVLFHEATFEDGDQPRAKETYHSTASQAATIARDAHVGQLIIGHFSARYDDESLLLSQAQKVFQNTILANENLCIDIKHHDL